MEFRLFGTVEASCDNGPVILGSPLQRRLLGVLALNLGTVVRTDRLITALTTRTPGPSTRRWMQNAVVRLRRSLAHDDEVRVLTVGAGYVLLGAPDSIDLYRAAALIRRSRREPEAETGTGNLQAAMTLWRTLLFGRLATAEMRQMAEWKIDELINTGFVPRFDVPTFASPRPE
jgi:DNA-binding SARP family transcriptional activator